MRRILVTSRSFDRVSLIGQEDAMRREQFELTRAPFVDSLSHLWVGHDVAEPCLFQQTGGGAGGFGELGHFFVG